ncbi:MAG: hypothetical protein KCHDKBKB_01739 [Elusimicrobia bacterium]|nr:hypothetical protein [Elusimicrobiota bacterium]
MIFRTFAAFFMRDLRQMISYRFAFLLDVASVVFTATTFFYVARLFDTGALPALQNYATGYFPFVLVGIAFSTYQTVGLNAFSQSLRQEQYVGTLESVLVTPIRIPAFLAGSALWDFLYASAEVTIYFIVAVTVFGLSLAQANIPVATLAILLTLSTFMGLGILAAAFILRFKKGNPVTWLIASTGELFGGVYFPTDILPDWMRSVAQWIPMTHALSALRKTLLLNADFMTVRDDLLFLLFFTLLVWPIGVLAFLWALKKSQEDGTLGHY